MCGVDFQEAMAVLANAELAGNVSKVHQKPLAIGIEFGVEGVVVTTECGDVGRDEQSVRGGW